MPRVKMLKTAAGPAGVFQSGQEYDLPLELAKAFLGDHGCVILPPAMETAVLPPAETREAETEPEPPPEWTLKMTPEEYLEKYPNGPKAVLAKAIVG